MNRRGFTLGGVAMILAGPVRAQSRSQAIVERIVAELRRQGYTEFRVRRTLLGRVLIDAEGPGKEREIVLNPNTGEILRDIWDDEGDDLFGRHPRTEDDGDSGGSGASGGSGSGPGGSGSGPGGSAGGGGDDGGGDDGDDGDDRGGGDDGGDGESEDGPDDDADDDSD